jgi:RNase P/RNase MRP subunit POP5
MTLNKQKFRYISVFFPNTSSLNPENFFDEFSARYVELFGVIEYFNSLCRLVKSKEAINNVILIKCKLAALPSTLVSLYLINHEIMVVSISGTLRQVKKKSHLFQKSFYDSSLSSRNLSSNQL